MLPAGRAIATHAALIEAGVPSSTIMRRISPTGPWQRLVPGVVLAHRGIPTRYERRLGALAYGGPDAQLTGLSALAEHGVQMARRLGDDRVHLLVPHKSHRTSHGFAHVSRTRRLPDPHLRRGLACAPLARALVDACRWQVGLDDVRELVAEVVQQHKVLPSEIAAEVRAAARQRTALIRAVLLEIGAGIRSVAEARLREEFRRRGVPEPEWNGDLLGPDGQVVAQIDAYWAALGLALEIDSMAWHLSPKRYRRTQKRQRRLVLLGIEVIPISPADVLEDPAAVCEEVMAKIATTTPRELPFVVRRRAAA